LYVEAGWKKGLVVSSEAGALTTDKYQKERQESSLTPNTATI
jgi:hypothetical protein